MILSHEPSSLTLAVVLEQGDPRVDLRDGLGEQLLRIGLAGCRECFRRGIAPDGSRWDALAESTLRERRRKGGRGSAPGLVTGDLQGGIDFDEGDHRIERDSAAWQYTREPFGKALAFNNGNDRNQQPPRPFLGWTRTAEQQAREALGAEADGRGSIDLAGDHQAGGIADMSSGLFG